MFVVPSLCNIFCVLYFINKISGSEDNHNTFYQRVCAYLGTRRFLFLLAESTRTRRRIKQIESTFSFASQNPFKYMATEFLSYCVWQWAGLM